MVPEPTEEMVERLATWFDRAPDDAERYARHAWRDIIAAASPEWLLRAALTEEEQKLALWSLEQHDDGFHGSSLYKKLSRALRGGEPE